MSAGRGNDPESLTLIILDSQGISTTGGEFKAVCVREPVSNDRLYLGVSKVLTLGHEGVEVIELFEAFV